MKKKFLTGQTLSITAILFISISFNSFSGQRSDTITINLGWYPQFQFAGFYAALNKGFYKEEGLVVKINTHDENRTSVDAVLSGPNQYGIGTGSMLMGNIDVDKLVVLAAIQQQSPIALVCLDDGRFEKLKDFEGKVVHGGTEMKAMFMSAGIHVESIRPPLNIPEIAGLETGKFDAMTMYITDFPIINRFSKANFKFFRPMDYGINFYGESLFTTQEEVESNPDRVDKVIAATKRGWEYALDHKSELATILADEYGSSFTHEQLLEEANIVETSLIIPSLYDIGNMQKSKWDAMSKALKVLGILKQDINLNAFVYERQPQNLWPFWRNFLIVLSVLAGSFGIGAVALFVFNVRLKKAVMERTAELNKLMEKLNISLRNEKHVTDNLEKLVRERTQIIEEQNEKLEQINSELEKRVQERTEVLQRANEELDMFIYSMSHDIRAPLASIQGLINVIAINPENKDEYIDLIGRNVNQLDFFIEEILEYTRNTKRELIHEEVDMEPLVNSVFGSLRHIEGAERIQTILEIENGIPVVTDKTRLILILRNIIANALKYQDHRKNNPFIKIVSKTTPDRVIITVEDNGIGISKEHLDKIFTMFYRATESSSGSGLGLYIVKEILDNMSGSIKVHSELQKGTTFKLEFKNHPLKPVNAAGESRDKV